MVLAAKCWNHREDDYDYSQPGLRFRLMSADQQAMLLANTVRAIGGAHAGNPDPPHRQLIDTGSEPWVWRATQVRVPN